MRVLHTSDWHLGAAIDHVDCDEEHARFLGWLIDEIDRRAIDVLVVAGDVFDYASPSNAARKLYFDFLGRCSRQASLRKVIVVAGNHDSPSGLDAPGDLLDGLDVHVVGALPRDRQHWGDCLVPVANDAGDVEVVVAAVPYVREAGLGVSLGDDGESELRRQYQQAFTELYAHLADQADQRWPEAALVGTGHLTVYGDADNPQPGDFHTGIHRTSRPRRDRVASEPAGIDAPDDDDALRRIGTIEAMAPSIFDARFDYIALGHIHRPMPVGGTRHIRYCGTPVAISRDEQTPARQVVIVDLSDVAGGQTLPLEFVDIPVWRKLFEISGSVDHIDELLAGMTSSADLPPIVFITIELGIDEPAGSDHQRDFQATIDDHHEPGQRPIIAEIREQYEAMPADGGGPTAEPMSLDDLDYFDVFEAMYRRSHPDVAQPPERLVEHFREIEQQLYDTDTDAS